MRKREVNTASLHLSEKTFCLAGDLQGWSPVFVVYDLDIVPR